MANMSCCQFESVYRDLRDCYEDWEPEQISEAEQKCRAKLLALCETIAKEFGELMP